MVDDPDIWRAANLLVKRYGTGAPMIAGKRSLELLAEGDVEGGRMWQRILIAVVELGRTKLAKRERVN